ALDLAAELLPLPLCAAGGGACPVTFATLENPPGARRSQKRKRGREPFPLLESEKGSRPLFPRAAFGIGTCSTGSRADLMVCDDGVDVRALRSRADRQRVQASFHENLLNQLEPDGRFWGLCTPWHPDDLNAELKQNPAFALFRRPVGDDLEPVWPEK